MIFVLTRHQEIVKKYGINCQVLNKVGEGRKNSVNCASLTKTSLFKPPFFYQFFFAAKKTALGRKFTSIKQILRLCKIFASIWIIHHLDDWVIWSSILKPTLISQYWKHRGYLLLSYLPYDCVCPLCAKWRIRSIVQILYKWSKYITFLKETFFNIYIHGVI